MIRTLSALAFSAKQDIRGGVGPAQGADYLGLDEMDGVLGSGRLILAAGSSIGEHRHPNTEELYLVLEGHGRAVLDGEGFPVGPGDLYLCKAGHSHGLANDGAGPLTLFTLMTRQAVQS